MKESRVLDSYLAVLESFAILFKKDYIERKMIITSSISRTLSDIYYHLQLDDYITCSNTVYPNLASLCRELWKGNL